MNKLNGFDFLEPIRETSFNRDVKRIAHTVNFGVYINNNAEMFLHDITLKKVIPFKTNKDITKDSIISSLITTYKLLSK